MTKKNKTTASEQLLEAIVNGMQEVKARDIVVLDLTNVPSAPSDYFVICHGGSSTQAEAIARSVEKSTIEEFGERPGHIEGVQNAQWILMDYFTIIVHVFEETIRSYYDLEELWADAEIREIA